jgi:hypothetical protein
MRSFGQLLMFLGGFAIVLDFFDRVPSLLMWIYNWGEPAAWGIKIALILVGAALWFMSNSDED